MNLSNYKSIRRFFTVQTLCIGVMIILANFLISCASSQDSVTAQDPIYYLEIEASNARGESLNIKMDPTSDLVFEACETMFDITRMSLYKDDVLVEEDPDNPTAMTLSLEADVDNPVMDYGTPGELVFTYIATITKENAEPLELIFALNIEVVGCERELRLSHAGSEASEESPLIIAIASSGGEVPHLTLTEVCMGFNPVLRYYEEGVEIENFMTERNLVALNLLPNTYTTLVEMAVSYQIEDAFGAEQTYSFKVSSSECENRLELGGVTTRDADVITIGLGPTGNVTLQSCETSFAIAQDQMNLYRGGVVIETDANANPPVVVTIEAEASNPAITYGTPGETVLVYTATVTEQGVAPSVSSYTLNVETVECIGELRLSHAGSVASETSPLVIPIASSSGGEVPGLTVTEVCTGYAPVLRYYEGGLEVANFIAERSLTLPNPLPNTYTSLVDEAVSYKVADVFNNERTYSFKISSSECANRLDLTGVTTKDTGGLTATLEPAGSVTLQPCETSFALDEMKLYRGGILLETDANANPPVVVTLEVEANNPAIAYATPGATALTYRATVTEENFASVESTFTLSVEAVECIRELRLSHAGSVASETSPLVIPIVSSSGAEVPSLTVTEVCTGYAPVLAYYEGGLEVANFIAERSLVLPNPLPNIFTRLEDEGVSYKVSDVFGNEQTYSFTLNSTPCPQRLTFEISDGSITQTFGLDPGEATQPNSQIVLDSCFTGTSSGSLPTPKYYVNTVLDTSVTITSSDSALDVGSLNAQTYTYTVEHSSGDSIDFGFTITAQECIRKVTIVGSQSQILTISYGGADSAAVITATDDIVLPLCGLASAFNSDTTSFTNVVTYFEDGNVVPENNRGYSIDVSGIPTDTNSGGERFFTSGTVNQRSNYTLALKVDDIFHSGEKITFAFDAVVDSCEDGNLFLRLQQTSTGSPSTVEEVTATYPSDINYPPVINMAGGNYYLLTNVEDNAPIFAVSNCRVITHKFGVIKDGFLVEDTADPDITVGFVGNDPILNIYYRGDYYTNIDSQTRVVNFTNQVDISGGFSGTFYSKINGECTVSDIAGGDGSEESPYQISDAFLLQLMSHLVTADKDTYGSANFKLMNDINLEVTGAPWSSNVGGEGFLPIGRSPNSYAGVFDCASSASENYTISNLYINRPDVSYIALFGYIYGPTSPIVNIKNCNLENVNVIGSERTAAVVGYGYRTGIENVHVLGSSSSVTGKSSTAMVAGGLAIGTLKDSSATGTVTGTSSFVGGGVGLLSVSPIGIDNFTFSGSVSSRADTGGVVGYVSNSSISNVSVSGSVSVTQTNVGGLVGILLGGGSLTSATSSADVSGGDDNAGGAVGKLEDSSVDLVSVSGDVLGNADVGGVVGYFTDSSLTRCKSEGDVAGSLNIGGIIGLLSNNNLDTITSVIGCAGIGESVAGTNQRAGGLIGSLAKSSENLTISQNYTLYNVSAPLISGGAIGIIGDTSTNVKISSIYAGGNVTGENVVGGIIGLQFGFSSISNVYASGVVSGGIESTSTDGANVGGMVGLLRDDMTVSDSYINVVLTNLGSTAETSIASFGGLVGGASFGKTLQKTDVYFNSDRSNPTVNIGGQTSTDSGKSTVELQSPTDATGIYAGWTDTCTKIGESTAVNVWDFGEATEYPVLNCLRDDAAEDDTADGG